MFIGKLPKKSFAIFTSEFLAREDGCVFLVVPRGYKHFVPTVRNLA